MRRRTVELAFLLPWVGVFLLTPPVVLMVQTWSKAAGFPLFILYIFVCWFGLIVAGAIVAIRIVWVDEERPHGEGLIAPDGGDD